MKPCSVAVPIPFSNSKPALIKIQPSLDSEKSLIMNGGVLDNIYSEENIDFGFYLKPKGLEKSSESQTKDKEGKLSLGEIQITSTDWDTIDISGVFSNQDMEMEISLNLVEDYPNEKIKLLRSWKRILRHPNTCSSTEAHETHQNHIKRGRIDCPLQEL